MTARLRLILVAIAGLVATAASAQQYGDVPSCYTDHRIGLVAAAPQRELIVAIDETTPLSPVERGAVTGAISRLVTPGSAFTIAGFSSYGQGRAVHIEASGAIEMGVPLQQRSGVAVPALKMLDACLSAQARFAQSRAAQAAQKVMASQSNALAHSDVMASLREISGRVRQSPAQQRIVLVVSDMIENSTATSFYKARGLRLVDPAGEMATARGAQLFGDFAGARVFVLGGGTLPDANGSRDIAAMDALQEFWSRWFAKSKAKLIEFGRPNLMAPVG